MASSIFCPVCQRKNSIDVNRCNYCGALLQQQASGIGMNTTLNIAPSLDMTQVDSLCEKHLQGLESGDICFILENKQSPIILHQVSEVLLGRFFDETDQMCLDLDPYGGGGYGVSRRHARIIQIDKKYLIEDLNSTNGSWLNGQRIPSGTTYPLMSGDQIWLGQFKMQACFHQGDVVSNTILFLRDTSELSKKLTPQSLMSGYGSYLNAISELQAIAADCLNLTVKDVVIDKIDASGSDAYVVVHIVNNPEALHLIRKWIMPWRLEQQLAGEDLHEEQAHKQAIIKLASKIITDITSDTSNEKRFSVIEKALPVVTILATGPIELSFEVS